jgi:hypothetical protein
MTGTDSPPTSRRCAASVRSGTIGTEIPVGSVAAATAGSVPGMAVGGVLTSPAVTPSASFPAAPPICPRRNALHAELRSTGADPDALGVATAGATATAAERAVATPAVTAARGRSRARRGSRKRTTLAGTSVGGSPTSGRSVVTNHPTAQPCRCPGSELPGGLAAPDRHPGGPSEHRGRDVWPQQHQSSSRTVCGCSCRSKWVFNTDPPCLGQRHNGATIVRRQSGSRRVFARIRTLG